jgi:Zn-dependent protease with chaperone function
MPAPKVPYPPSPTDVPDDLTDYPPSYRSQQNLLLAGLFIFLLFYFGLIALCLLVITFCVVTMNHYAPVKVAGIALFGFGLLFLVKGFFKRRPVEKEMQLEITEDEQPVLFGFIHLLCDELDAPEPNRVFVSPDVNAAVILRSSLVNLFVEPRKDLLIGLGLVNCTNLSEFKSVLAHEFGHFCQSGYISSYSYVASQIILDLIIGEDFLDRFIAWCKRQEGAPAALGYTLGGLVWLGRKPLELVFKVITLQRLVVSREQEFHADLVAVKAAGSDAVPLSLMRLRFGNLCLMQAFEDLSLAADHKLFTRDLFHHQDRAEPTVRKNKKNPKLGERPVSDDPMAGKDVQIFDPEEEEEEHDEIPEMRRTHPPAHETEENAKATFIPAVVDTRSPWVLFTDADELKERMTYKFYRMAFKVKKNVELVDPAEVQQFIDDEHAETTYDPKYQGIYDGRPLSPGEISDLTQMVRESPWDEDRIDKVFAKLYEGAGGKNEEYQELKKDKAALENTPGRPSPRLKKKIKAIEKELDRHWEWFKSLDRRVYLCHVQMAAAVNPDWRDELVERYRFGLEIQKFYMDADHHAEKAFFFARVLFDMENPHPEFVGDVMQILREAWRALKKIVQEARDINMPAMKNFEEGERLADFILEGKMVPEPPLSYVKANWINKLLDQLRGVRRRCGRLHWKSVGGILAMQEKIATAWQERRAPVEAELGEVVEAEVLPADVLTATVVGTPLDALPKVADKPTAEVIEAEVVEAEVIEAVDGTTVAPPLAGVVVENFIEAEVVEAEPVEAVVAVPAPTPQAPPPLPAPAAPPPLPASALAPPKRPTPPVVPVMAARAMPTAPLAEPRPAIEQPPAPAVAAPPEPERTPESPPEPTPKPAPALVVESPPDPVFTLPTNEPEPPATPAAALPDEPVAAIFTLDGAGAEPPSPVQPVIPEGVSKTPGPLDDFFSLDADEIASFQAAPAVPTLLPKPAIPHRGAEEKNPSPSPSPEKGGEQDSSVPLTPPSLPGKGVGGLGSSIAPPTRAAARPDLPHKGGGEEGAPQATAEPAPASAPAPAPKPASPSVIVHESPTTERTVTKPAKKGRPALKITYVLPGEKSPLAG